MPKSLDGRSKTFHSCPFPKDISTKMDLKLIIAIAIVVTIALQVVVSAFLRRGGDARTKKKNQVGVEDLQHEGLHLARRIQHAATGLLFYGISYTELGYRFRLAAVATLLACSVVVYLVHLLRLRNPQVRDFLARTYASILRPKELEGAVPGAFFFLLGVGLSSALVSASVHLGNDENLAMEAFRLGLLYLSLGDPLAAIVGTWVSSRQTTEPTGGKTWYGSVACFLVCALSTLGQEIVHRGREILPNDDLVFLVILGGVVGMATERLSLGDDNFSIPVLSTTVFLLLQHFQGIDSTSRIKSEL